MVLHTSGGPGNVYNKFLPWAIWILRGFWHVIIWGVPELGVGIYGNYQVFPLLLDAGWVRHRLVTISMWDLLAPYLQARALDTIDSGLLLRNPNQLPRA